MVKSKMVMKSKDIKNTKKSSKKIHQEENNSSKINIELNEDTKTQLTMDFVKEETLKTKSHIKSTNPELEKIWNDLNTERKRETSEYNLLVNYQNNSDIDIESHEHKYSEEEITKIVSNEGRKILTDKIKQLQKAEWIEVFRVIKANETKHYQENNSGIWIVMNKLKDETILKLYKLVEYSFNNKEKLESEKIKRNRIRDTIKSGKIKNDEDFLKESQLLNDNIPNNEPSGFSDKFDNGVNIGADAESNLKVDISMTENNTLLPHQLDDLVSQRLMARKKDDVEYSSSQQA